MIKSMKSLSKSSTAKWATVLTLMATMFITNQDTVIELSTILFGAESAGIVAKVLSVLGVLIGYTGTLKGRLNTESKPPLSER